MKSFAVYLILFSLYYDINAQERFPLQFDGNLRSDLIYLKKEMGSTNLLFHGEMDFAVSISTEDLHLLKGGEIYVQGMGVMGNQASANYAGDLQVFSNIESENRLFLYQCYYSQRFNKLHLKFGQIDMNSDYLISSWASTMINSSFGVIPTISLNMPASIFAYLAPGISLKFQYSKRLAFQTVFFGGNPGDFETNRHNLRWNLKKDDGWFNITEFSYKTKSELRLGKYKAGFFYHSGSTGETEFISGMVGNSGFYMIGDQQLTLEKNTIRNGLSMFFQLSGNLVHESMIRSYYSMGLMYRGMFPGMNEDEFTIALASVKLGKKFMIKNPDYLSNETIVEMTYKKHLFPFLIIQPDFQYIINPGATNLYDGNAAVCLIRTIISI